MNDLLTLSSQGDDTLNKIFTGKPYLLNIEGSINICMTLCGQEIDGCSVVHFANMKNIGKAIVLNIDNKKNYTCSIKLAFDSSSDSTNANGIGSYKLEKVFFTTPSLHKINNTVYDGEIFIVYSSVQKNGDKLYVCMCSFIQGVDSVQQTDWRFTSYKLMNELFGDVTKIPPVNSTNPINSPPNPIDVNHFLPREGYRNFYEYTHPMNNLVNFRIFQNPLYASKQVINNIQNQILPGTQYTNFRQMIQSYINPPKGVFIFFSQDMTKNVDAALNGQLTNPNCKTIDVPIKSKNNKKKRLIPKIKKSKKKSKSSSKTKPKSNTSKKSKSSKKKKTSSKKSNKKKEKFENYSDNLDENFENFENDEDEDFENESDEDFENESSNEDFENESSNEDFENDEDEDFENDENEDFENDENEDFENDEDEDFENDEDDEDFENVENNNKENKENFKNDDNNSLPNKKKNFALGMFFLLNVLVIILSYIISTYGISKFYYILIFLSYIVLIAVPYMIPDTDIKKMKGDQLFNFRKYTTYIFMTTLSILYGLYVSRTFNKDKMLYYIVLFLVLFFLWYFLIIGLRKKAMKKLSEDSMKFKEQLKVRRSQNLVSLTLGYFIIVPFILFVLLQKILNDPSFKNSKQVVFDYDSTLNAFKNPKFLKILSDKLWFYISICLQIILTCFIFFNFLIKNNSNFVVIIIYMMGVFFFVSLYYVARYVLDRMDINLNDFTTNKLDSYYIFSMGLSYQEMFSLLFNPQNTVITSKLKLQESGMDTVQQGGSDPIKVKEPIPGPINVISEIQKQLNSDTSTDNNLNYLLSNLSATAITFFIIFLIIVFIVSILLVITLIYNNNKILFTYPIVGFLLIFAVVIIAVYVYLNNILTNFKDRKSFIGTQFSNTPGSPEGEVTFSSPSNNNSNNENTNLNFDFNNSSSRGSTSSTTSNVTPVKRVKVSRTPIIGSTTQQSFGETPEPIKQSKPYTGRTT